VCERKRKSGVGPLISNKNPYDCSVPHHSPAVLRAVMV